MAGPIKISFLADVGRAQKDIKSVGETAQKTGKQAETSGGGVSKGFNAIGDAAVKMNAAVSLAGDGLASIDQIQNAAKNEAARLARAQADVEQAMADGRQAAIDLRQATEDLKQSQIDGRQAAIDMEQAQIDSKQADLDVALAQKEYNAAVKEFGKGSAEARQAEIDLAQAKSDGKQATEDFRQAQADQRQALIDGAQAQEDSKQAQIDAKDAVLNLTDAQRELNRTPIQQAMAVFATYAPALAAVATLIPSIAGATKVWTAVQAAFNFVMAMNPIVLVIIAIVALIAVIVIAWKKSETFRAIVTGAFNAVLNAARAAWGWVKNNWPLLLAVITGPIGIAVRWVVQHWGQIVAAAKRVPGQIAAVFSGIGSWLVNAGKNLIRGFINGLVSMFDPVKSTLRGLTSRLTSWKGPEARDRTLLFGAGRSVIGGFQEGLESEYGSVRNSLGGFTDSIGAVGSVNVTAGAPAWAQKLIKLLDGGLTLTLESSGSRGDDAVLELIRDRVRAKGGRVSVLGVTR